LGNKILNELDWIYGMHGRQDRCILDLVGRPDGKRPLGRPKHKGKDTIKMELKKWDWEAWAALI
jgi:hypothetical protein